MLPGTAPLVDSRHQKTVPAEVWRSLKAKNVTVEQDTRPKETKKLRKEYYRAPKFEHAKERFIQDIRRCNFFETLSETIMLDLAADLDLPIRFGAHMEVFHHWSSSMSFLLFH
ncbi:MAG: hypothetical protein H0U71_01770 [Gammaproteobacteria bacterium]|nr:hypothetical protein [Gammaproteobacteria bacterium]